MNPIAQSLYLARLQKGLSQKELAHKAGMPQPNISQIEKGRDLKVSTLYQLAMALEVSPEDLFRGVAPIRLNKNLFFKRGNIERVAADLARNKKTSRATTPTAQLLESVIGKDKGTTLKKNLHLSWAILKKTFSREEINAILSRVEKAKARRS